MTNMDLPFDDPNANPDPNGDSKKRKLDELFANEPYLSPTMKARLLHERLQQAQERDSAPQEIPTEAFVGPILSIDPVPGEALPLAPLTGEPDAAEATPLNAAPLNATPLNAIPLNTDSLSAEAVGLDANPAETATGQSLNGATPTANRSKPPIRLEEMLRLPEAASYLRGGDTSLKSGSDEGRIDAASFARLTHFRTQVLEKWLKNLPENRG